MYVFKIKLFIADLKNHMLEGNDQEMIDFREQVIELAESGKKLLVFGG